MTKTYIEARRSYKRGEFHGLRVSQECGSYFWIEKDGRGLECFATEEAARAHIHTETTKAAKWIKA